MEDTVTISKKEYQKLKEDVRFLECLRSAGVDNWEWFSEACDQFEGEEE